MASARRLRRPQPPEEAANAATATGGSRLRCRSRRAWAAVVLAGSFQKVLEATAAGETAQMLRLASLASRVPTSAEEFRKPLRHTLMGELFESESGINRIQPQ